MFTITLAETRLLTPMMKWNTMMAIKQLLILISILLLHSPIFSQHVTHKARLGAELNFKAGQFFVIGSEFEQRLTPGFRLHDRFLIEPSIQFKPIKLLALGVKYRHYWYSNEQNNFLYAQQFFVYLRVLKSFNNWSVYGQVMYQNTMEINDYQFAFIPGYFTLRPKIRSKYHIFGTRYSLNASSELFYEYKGLQFNKIRMRSEIAASYKINKVSEVNAGIMYQTDTKNPKDKIFIWNVKYEFNL